jgi:hypothetical protein
MWCIAPEQNARFVCAMENVLEVYKRPYDPKHPVICFDETSKQLIDEKRSPLPTAPGKPARFDYEYERKGTANLFMLCQPLRGWRKVNVTQRRARCDFAEQIKQLVDVHFVDAQRITLVMDNLVTHELASLYEAFDPVEARRLLEKIEPVHTPKHGSWLNIAEIELSVLQRQCTHGRIADSITLKQKVSAWEQARNDQESKVDWQFTADDARIKLRRLYPKFSE